MNQDKLMFTMFNQGKLSKIITSLRTIRKKDYERNVETFNILKDIEHTFIDISPALEEELKVFDTIISNAIEFYNGEGDTVTEIIVGGWWWELLNRVEEYSLPNCTVKITPKNNWEESTMLLSNETKPSMEILYRT